MVARYASEALILEVTQVAYKPFLIRKQSDGARTFDSSKEWELYCSSFPFQVIGDAKDVPSRSWNDEHGDDEFIPKTICIKSYEIDVDLACRGDKEHAYNNIINFLKYITGRDTENSGETYGSTLQIYDTYTTIGRQYCRYVKCENKGYEVYDVVSDSVKEETLTAFTVTFKVNDPITDIKLEV